MNAPTATFSHAGCTIEIFPIPKSVEARCKSGLRPLGMLGPGEAEFLDDARALRSAVRQKAKRYRPMEKPFVIAVNAMAQHLDSMDINDALFGQESSRVFDDICAAALPKQTRTMNGVWINARGPVNTRVAAVLITSSLSPWSVHVRKPIIYHNPWAKFPVEEAFEGITAVVPSNNRLRIIEGKSPTEVFCLPESLVDAFENHN